MEENTNPSRVYDGQMGYIPAYDNIQMKFMVHGDEFPIAFNANPNSTRGWVRQSECLSSKQNNRIHFGMCTKHTNGLCRMPSYPRPHKRWDSKFNKMTHMTENIYCLTKIVGKLVGFDLNLCVYNHYDAEKKQRINMHSDTQTNNPKEIAHKQFTPVVMAK